MSDKFIMVKQFESKYIPLSNYFKKCIKKEFILTYEEIEAIIGQALPNAAYLSSSWWKKTKPPALHYFAWINYGYSVKDVVLGETVIFQAMNEVEDEENDIDQDILVIREAELEDARPFITLQEAIFSETDFMLYGESDFQMTVQHIRKQMTVWKSSPNSVLFLAIMNGQFAGFILLQGHSAPRARHRSSLVIGVKKQFSRKGVASSLINRAFLWAKQNGVTKLELTVVKENMVAYRLYQKAGFENEGLRKNSLLIKGQYVDEYYMGRVIESEN
mgnify:FL=1